MRTGAKLWSAELAAKYGLPPFATNGRVLVCAENTAYCFSTNNGKKNWSFQADSLITTSPNSDNERAVFGTKDGTLFCLSEATGKKLWQFQAKGPIQSMPALSDGKCFFGSLDKQLRCVDMATGKQLWSYDAGEPITESVAYDDGRVVFVEGNNVYSMESDTGKPRWKFSAIRAYYSPSVSSGKVFVPSDDFFLYCLDANLFGKACCISPGKRLWSFMASASLQYQAFATKTKVILPTTDGNIFCINMSDGSMDWTFTPGVAIGKMAIADGRLYMVSLGTLVCFDKFAQKLEFQIGNANYVRDGIKLDMETPLAVYKGASFVPAKYAVAPFGGTVTYDSNEKMVVCRLNGKTVKLWVGKPEAQVDSKMVQIDQDKDIVPFIKNGRALVPVRFISFAFQLLLSFDGKTKTILLETGK